MRIACYTSSKTQFDCNESVFSNAPQGDNGCRHTPRDSATAPYTTVETKSRTQTVNSSTGDVRVTVTHHVVHLMCNILEPVLHALCPRDHASQLASDYRLRIERFAEYLPLVCPPIGTQKEITRNGSQLSEKLRWRIIRNAHEAFPDDSTLATRGRAAHHPPLMIEVAMEV